MRKTAFALAAIGALGLGSLAAPSPAEAGGGFGPAIGGFAAGAVIGGLATAAYAQVLMATTAIMARTPRSATRRRMAAGATMTALPLAMDTRPSATATDLPTMDTVVRSVP